MITDRIGLHSELKGSCLMILRGACEAQPHFDVNFIALRHQPVGDFMLRDSTVTDVQIRSRLHETMNALARRID